MESSPRITLYDIARLAGTSKSTVSRVLTNHPRVAPETRERVLAVMQAHSFSPNPLARGLSHGRKGLVAALAGSLAPGYYTEVLYGLNEAVRQTNGHLLTSFHRTDEEYVQELDTMLARNFVDGIILIAPPQSIFRRPLPAQAPILVTCSARPSLAHPSWGSCGSATVDNAAGFRNLLDILIQQGCRSFLHLAGPADVWDAIQRRETFERHLRASPGCTGAVLQASRSQNDSRLLVSGFLKSKAPLPDAFVCFNDSTAIGAIQALTENNIDRNRVRVTGCDHEAFADFLGFPTLDMPMQELGRSCAAILDEILRQVDAPRHRVLPLTPVFPTSTLTVFDLRLRQ